MAAVIPQPAEVNDDVQCAGNLASDGSERKLCAAEHHGFKARQHILWRICVSGGERAVMSGVHRLQHIQSLCAAHLSDDDPVRVHAETCADQVRYGDGALALCVGTSRLQTHQIFDVLELKLGGILNGNNPFFIRYERRECVEKGGLSGVGPSADENIILLWYKSPAYFYVIWIYVNAINESPYKRTFLLGGSNGE